MKWWVSQIQLQIGNKICLKCYQMFVKCSILLRYIHLTVTLFVTVRRHAQPQWVWKVVGSLPVFLFFANLVGGGGGRERGRERERERGGRLTSMREVRLWKRFPVKTEDELSRAEAVAQASLQDKWLQRWKRQKGGPQPGLVSFNIKQLNSALFI